jgi:DNA-binding NarL/FixJ family response regulator
MSSPARATTEPKRADRGRLSQREMEVLALLVEGCPNKKIGRRLGISENTAKFHVTSILNKLGVASIAASKP